MNLRQLIDQWKEKHPEQAGEVENFKQWVEEKIGIQPANALSPAAWTVESFSTAISLLSDEEVDF